MQKKQKVDMVIMGTSGVSEESILSKTNTSELVLEADFPVLVIPKNAKSFRIKHIALVLGKEKIEDTEALQTLLDLARKFNAKVHVLTIENKPGSYGYSNIDVENESTLGYYLENFYVDHTFIRNPDLVEGIFSYVSKKDIDVITILPRNHIKEGEASEGQLTQMLTLHSKVPILAID
jgi:nucleotide-binding universal stress UspA family protein